jgi:hypothetical protein
MSDLAATTLDVLFVRSIVFSISTACIAKKRKSETLKVFCKQCAYDQKNLNKDRDVFDFLAFSWMPEQYGFIVESYDIHKFYIYCFGFQPGSNECNFALFQSGLTSRTPTTRLKRS